MPSSLFLKVSDYSGVLIVGCASNYSHGGFVSGGTAYGFGATNFILRSIETWMQFILCVEMTAVIGGTLALAWKNTTIISLSGATSRMNEHLNP